MEKLIKSLVSVFVVVFMISMNSCDEINDVVPIPSMKATVDGEAWTSIFRLSVLNESQTSPSFVIIGTPTASESADKAIILTTFGAEAGTYTLNTLSLVTECAVAYKKTADAATGGDDYYIAYEATITITSLDLEKKQMSGTFNAKLRSTGNLADEVVITNGTFENLNYQIK